MLLMGQKITKKLFKTVTPGKFTHDLGVSYLYLVIHCSYDKLAK